MSQTRRAWFDRLFDTSVVAAILALIGVLAANYLGDDNSKCRIATDFLMDDIKDKRIVDEETAKRLSILYTGMAEENCDG